MSRNTVAFGCLPKKYSKPAIDLRILEPTRHARIRVARHTKETKMRKLKINITSRARIKINLDRLQCPPSNNLPTLPTFSSIRCNGFNLLSLTHIVWRLPRKINIVVKARISPLTNKPPLYALQPTVPLRDIPKCSSSFINFVAFS